MSNRSKKNPLIKEANDTLKRILIAPECRSHMMELMTGSKPKNGKESLEWSLSNKHYLEVENEYNNKLAEYITCLRHEMVDKIKVHVQTNKGSEVNNKYHKELEIVILAGRLKHLCDIYKQEKHDDFIWNNIILSVQNLTDILTTA